MPNSILCSVIISAYNAEAFIAESIISILSQSIKNIEVIVMDDCSCDSTADIVQAISFVDNRVKLIKSSHNKGQPLQFNDAIVIAKGEFISFFDADDIAVPSKLEKQIRFLKDNPDYSIVGCNLLKFNNRDIFNTSLIKFSESYGEIQADNLFRCPIISGAIVIRKEVILDSGIFFRARKMGPDWDFIDRLLPFYKAYNIQEPLFLYRTHSSQVTSKILELDTIDFETTSLRERALIKLGVIPSIRDLKVHLAVSPNRYWDVGDHPYFREVEISAFYEGWLSRISQANKVSGAINQFSLDKYLDSLKQSLNVYFLNNKG